MILLRAIQLTSYSLWLVHFDSLQPLAVVVDNCNFTLVFDLFTSRCCCSNFYIEASVPPYKCPSQPGAFVYTKSLCHMLAHTSNACNPKKSNQTQPMMRR